MLRTLALAIFLTAATVLHAEDLSKPVVLVATPAMEDPLYGGAVIIVAPVGGDQHVGFIINKPTDLTLGNIFPADGLSQKVQQPVYIGGPFQPRLIVALVQRTSSPGGKSLKVMPGVYASVDAETVEAIFRDKAAHARFVTGLVTWREGELAAELQARAWYVLKPDEHLLDAPASGLWEALVHRAVMDVI